jgi:hypothetical protein
MHNPPPRCLTASCTARLFRGEISRIRIFLAKWVKLHAEHRRADICLRPSSRVTLFLSFCRSLLHRPGWGWADRSGEMALENPYQRRQNAKLERQTHLQHHRWGRSAQRAGLRRRLGKRRLSRQCVYRSELSVSAWRPR